MLFRSRAVIQQIAKERSDLAQQKKKFPSAPAMPVEPADCLSSHRDKIPPNPKDAEWFASCVAKSINKKEALSIPAAKASLDKE